MFLNIYKIDDVGDVDPTYMIYVAIVTTVVFLVSLPLSKLITSVPDRRGVISQVMYRSNYALIGLPLVELICGSDGLSEAALLSVVSVSLFNAFAVISLSLFGEEKKHINFKKILIDIIKNPLIIAIVAGLVCLLIRKLLGACDISFRLSQITPIFRAITYIANSATPVALLCLGTTVVGSIAQWWCIKHRPWLSHHRQCDPGRPRYYCLMVERQAGHHLE